MDAELVPVQARLTAEPQRRLDTLTGQIRSLDPQQRSLVIGWRRNGSSLSSLQTEYDAITLAMDALTQANTTLQNRFLSRRWVRGGGDFLRHHGGRYGKVLLS